MDQKRTLARTAAVAQMAVRKHEPNQERSQKELKDRARAAAKKASAAGVRVKPEKLKEAVVSSVVRTYYNFADAIIEGMR